MVQMVLPDDANPLGFVLGGKVMHLIDIAGAIACGRHTRSRVVTAAVDGLTFLHPIKVGDLNLAVYSLDNLNTNFLAAGDPLIEAQSQAERSCVKSYGLFGFPSPPQVSCPKLVVRLRETWSHCYG